jgi:hypothetical protein
MVAAFFMRTKETRFLCYYYANEIILNANSFCANQELIVAAPPRRLRRLVGGEGLLGRSAPNPYLHKT